VASYSFSKMIVREFAHTFTWNTARAAGFITGVSIGLKITKPLIDKTLDTVLTKVKTRLEENEKKTQETEQTEGDTQE
jgi:hypothetical protein